MRETREDKITRYRIAKDTYAEMLKYKLKEFESVASKLVRVNQEWLAMEKTYLSEPKFLELRVAIDNVEMDFSNVSEEVADLTNKFIEARNTLHDATSIV